MIPTKFKRIPKNLRLQKSDILSAPNVTTRAQKGARFRLMLTPTISPNSPSCAKPVDSSHLRSL